MSRLLEMRLELEFKRYEKGFPMNSTPFSNIAKAY